MSNSKIEKLIDEIEDYIENCKYRTFSNTEIIVNKDEIAELLAELRRKTPDEIRRYQKIIENKEAILNDAREKAEVLINRATQETNELVSEHQIMQQAHAQAYKIVELATQQAQSVLDAATVESNNMKIAAMEYTDEMLGGLDGIITHAIQDYESRYDSLLENLKNSSNIVRSNRAELHPVDELLQEVSDEDAANDEIELDMV